jgi:hemoglobin-like flavoprotein
MNTQQIQLVQDSFAQVVPIADTAADLFYARLFELDPSLRPMFPGDLREQKKKLVTMLTVAVNGLSRLEQIVPAVQELGRRHGGYGVTPAHYDTVAAALLWTLEQGLGDAFTLDVHAAWVETYTLLATTMQNAAAEANALRAHIGRPEMTYAQAAN